MRYLPRKDKQMEASFTPAGEAKSVMPWEMTLESLRQLGWGYGYGKCLDSQTGSEIYLVNLRRGDKRLTILKPTIEEAVTTISRLAEEDS